MDPWADIKSAIQNLKKEISKRKGDFRQTIERLPVILSALESSTFSDNLVQELQQLLRKPFVPVYNTFLIQSLTFASVLLDGIHKHKISAVWSKDRPLANKWERVQTSIIAGLIDFVEIGTTSRGVKIENIAKYIFPVLCQHYFASTPTSSCADIFADLRSNAYILLSDSVRGQPTYQSKLRDVKLLGGCRIGLTISRTTEYLVLETLFELLGNIVPADKHGIPFTDALFDPAQFDLHLDLKAIVSSLKCKGWDSACLELFHVLSRQSFHYPQPVQIVKATMSNDSPSPCTILYVDRTGLTSNIDVGDEIDTFHVPYERISKIRYSRYESSPTSAFTFDLKAAPTIGSADVTTPQAIAMTIEVPTKFRQHFVDSLISRGLIGVFDESQRKISNSKNPLILDFSQSQHTFPEKANQVMNHELSQSSDSPVPVPSKADCSKPSPRKKTTVKPSYKEKAIRSEDDSGYESNRRKRIGNSVSLDPHWPISDSHKLLQSPLSKAKSLLSWMRKLSKKIYRLMMVFQNPLLGARSPKKTDRKKEIPARNNNKENKLAGKPKQLQDNVFVVKRKAFDTLDEGQNSSGRPAKRSRPNAEPEKPVDISSSPLAGKASRNATAAKRYGKRGRHSPALEDDNADDFDSDSLPNVSSAKTSEKPSVHAAKELGIASAMQGKAGRKGIHATTEKVKTAMKGSAKGKHPPAPVEEVKPARRSARVAFKQAIETKTEPQSETNDDMQDEDDVSKLANIKAPKEDAKELTKLRPKPKPVTNKKSVPKTAAEPSNLPKFTAETQPPKFQATKTKKNKKAPWDDIEQFKEKQEGTNRSPLPTKIDPVSNNNIASPVKIGPASNNRVPSAMKIDPVSTLEDSPSGIDPLAQQQPSFENCDQGQDYMDVVIPPRPGPDENSDSNRSEFEVEPAQTPDLPLPNPKVVDLPAVISSLVKVTADVNVPLNSTAETRSRQFSNPEHTVPETKTTHQLSPPMLSYHRDLNNTSNASNKRNAPSAPSHALPATSVPLQHKASTEANAKLRLNHLPVNKPQSSTLADNASVPNVDFSSLSASEHGTNRSIRKHPAGIGSLRKTALDTLVGARVTFSPLPQFTPIAKYEPSAIAGREVHDRTRRPRDDHNSHPDDERGPQYPPTKQGKLDQTSQVHGIVEILHEVQEVIITKISNRFEGVKKEVRVGRDSILRAAAADVDSMRAESAEHFNALVDLEAEYASYRRRLVGNLEDLCSVDDEIVGRLGEIIQHHDRHALSKKFPKTFPAIPACFR
ncbi:hypothetical protein BDP27DRAFT_65742 [Rhodocollybia butyracea]|uniref:Plant heme peroxidase family profile domain-containing protein n=1 Tax=Rhodocollybia butyracea TaxID=206335 RepID=A0A9P5U460_9AGAR|nr:hypothetical protein BDP27DRAFT_65742 [Rhodocollybia butyracea]